MCPERMRAFSTSVMSWLLCHVEGDAGDERMIELELARDAHRELERSAVRAGEKVRHEEAEGDGHVVRSRRELPFAHEHYAVLGEPPPGLADELVGVECP